MIKRKLMLHLTDMIRQQEPLFRLTGIMIYTRVNIDTPKGDIITFHARVDRIFCSFQQIDSLFTLSTYNCDVVKGMFVIT